jgi:hypothetical protein
MNKAAELAKRLEHVDIAEGLPIIEKSYEDALHFDAISEDAMCVMHDDGSVNIFEIVGGGRVTTEVIPPAIILRVLLHYRPFKEVLKGNVQ